jgi:hypothetical protein
MMIIRVMYTDYDYDYVDAATLDRLINHKRIRKFVRPSEDAWIDIAQGPIRGLGGTYNGPERRGLYLYKNLAPANANI